MKIGSERSVVNLEAYVKNAQNGEGVKQALTQVQGNSVQAENVKLSATAKELQQARKAMEATPEIRTDLVEKLKREIETETYSANADREAEKMLRESWQRVA